MRPPFDILCDYDTPVSAWAKMSSLRPRFLLESVANGAHRARYSFLGFGEALEVRLDERGLAIGGRHEPRPRSAGELLDALRRAQALAPRPGPEVDGLPYRGGLVGTAAYDLVRYLERIPDGTRPTDESIEAAYVAPRSVLVFDHLTHRAAVLHDGDESERRRVGDEVRRALRQPLPAGPSRRACSEAVGSLGRDEFCERVAAAQHYIDAGDVFQLVLSVKFSGECELAPLDVYRALRGINPSPYMYFLDLGDQSVIGASPEALVQLRGREGFLRPIAGTRPRGGDEPEDVRLERELLADPKEAAEHVMLVDLARNDLGRMAVPGSVRVDPYRVIERYSHVMHIVSGVRGTLRDDADAFDLFGAAFPAGTVVGAPKVRAMEIIDELEPVRRGIYAGTVGYFDHSGDMDQAIAIRTLVMGGGRYSFQAGAGIVADSVPELEYAEVMAKSHAARSALELAAQGV